MIPEEVKALFEPFSKITALVIGDAMVDSYLWGKVERVSPEAPIPVVSVIKKEERLGGAANVSLNLQSLGAVPLLFSVTGDDKEGERFFRMMTKSKLSTQGIFVDPTRITTVKNRIISDGKHIVRLDEESTEFIDEGLETTIFGAIRQTVETRKIDLIVFIDYDKGMITPTLFQKVLDLAKEKKIPIAVDPKKRNFLLYHEVDLFKPNFKEFIEGTGQSIRKGDIDHLKAVAGQYQKEKSFRFICITLSELGVFISHSQDQSYYPAEIRYIADVTGAGDTVMAVVSLCLASSVPPHLMAVMANLAGGLVCEQLGVVPVNRESLMREMGKTDIRG